MRLRHAVTLSLAVLALVAAGCGEAKQEEAAPDGAAAPAKEPDVTVRAEPEPESAPATWWQGHAGDVEWSFGVAQGLAVAEETGKPAMIFYTGEG